MKLNIVEDILTKNDCYKVGKTISPIGLQLHTIGAAQNTSKALRDYWNQSGVEACVHYCVDAESEGLIRHFLPDNRRSWGDGGFGNANLITVELMESDYMKYTGGANYTVTNESKFKSDVTRAYNTAVYFFAYKCKQYGWNPLEKMSNGLYRISSHDEGRRLGLSTAHVDPTHIWNRYGWTMDQFRRDVKKVMDGGEISINTDTSSTSSSAKYYRVRKTWSDEKSQLGAYTILQNAKDNCPVGYSVFDESGKAVYTLQSSNNSSSTSGTHTSEFANLTDEQSAAKLLEVATPIAKEYGLLPSVLAAQCVLESGFCKTELAKKADNILGMKTNLLNSTWTSPTWDGKSSVTILTPEYYNGVKVMVNAPFRKYSCIEDCMKDRCAFFLNAKVSVNAAHPKYYGVTNCKTYKEQITFIKEHGYATDPNYISKVCDIIKRYSLDVNDGSSSAPSTPSQPSITTSKTPYRVATSYNGGKFAGQIDAYNVLDNAKKRASEASQSAKKTYYVYDNTGAIVYTAEYKSSSTTSGKITKVSEWISALENWGKKMVEVGAVYNNSGNKTDYTVALRQKPVTTNCALYATHALQVAGLFTKTDKFYGATGGSLKGSGATTLTTKIGKIVAEYPKANTTTDKLNLIPGDIVTYYEQHTNVYIGKDAKGKKVWIDAGRGTSVKGCTGSMWKSFKRTGEIGGMHVAKVIRLNLIDDVSKKETTTAKPSSSTPKKLYDVKVTITDLRIRKTPNGTIKGYIKPGVYGITEEKTVNGIKWGHLLSSVGWIALDYVTRL